LVLLLELLLHSFILAKRIKIRIINITNPLLKLPLRNLLLLLFNSLLLQLLLRFRLCHYLVKPLYLLIRILIEILLYQQIMIVPLLYSLVSKCCSKQTNQYSWIYQSWIENCHIVFSRECINQKKGYTYCQSCWEALIQWFVSLILI